MQVRRFRIGLLIGLLLALLWLGWLGWQAVPHLGVAAMLDRIQAVHEALYRPAWGVTRVCAGCWPRWR